MAFVVSPKPLARFPLLELLNPRSQTVAISVVLLVGIVLSTVLVFSHILPLWLATMLVLSALLYPMVQKWRDDLQRFGRPAMVLSILLALQGFHMVEHLAQWTEYHILQWQPRDSSGLLSAANVEIVHFVWNWAVLITELYLIRAGMRGWWAFLLVAWTTAHTLEHTYLLQQYLRRLSELRAQSASLAFAQGLPGVIGQNGWLATAPATENTFLCTLPVLTTAIRLDVHFWWNIGETVLLLPAAHVYVRQLLADAPASVAVAASAPQTSRVLNR